MGAYSIERKLDIKADPKTIWDAILDVASWPQWKPFITSTVPPKGEFEKGAKFRMNIKVKGPALPVPVEILEITPERYVAWTGGLPGLSRSVHSFIIEPGDGATTLTSKEEFTGALVGLMLLFVTPKDLEKLHDDWLEAVLKRVEEA